MRLTNRVSAFFLGTLAIVLAGSGFALYQFTASYLSRRTDERLLSGLDTLSSAVEIKKYGIEWEPNQRNLTLGVDSGEDELRWTVRTAEGRVVAQSPNLGDANLEDDKSWRSLSREITAASFNPPFKRGKYSDQYHERLILTVAASPNPGRVTLGKLAEALVGIGILSWLLAAGVGRYLVRRALAPVRRMATAAATMSAADLNHRLTLSGTGDELDEFGTAFNGLLGRLEAAFERQRRFTGDAAHQLSTPLTVLLGQLEVALRRERSAADYRAAIAEAHAQAVNLRQIVELLLFLARPESDAVPPAKQPLELSTWLSDQVARWKNNPRAADVHLKLPTSSPAKIATVPTLLGQLFDNLLDNACKYSSPGTPITVALHTDADAVSLRVEDAGIGIGPDDLGHIFEPFYRSPEARRLGKQGVGLGLAVARRVASALGGTLSVQSQLGRGSLFELRLPKVTA